MVAKSSVCRPTHECRPCDWRCRPVSCVARTLSFCGHRHRPAAMTIPVGAGRLMQQPWIIAIRLGRMHQKELTQLNLSRNMRDGAAFRRSAESVRLGQGLYLRTAHMIGLGSSQVVWTGRFGEARPEAARPIRRAQGQSTGAVHVSVDRRHSASKSSVFFTLAVAKKFLASTFLCKSLIFKTLSNLARYVLISCSAASVFSPS